MRGSDILFFQCQVKNSTHLAPGLQVVSAGAALSTPALVFKSPTLIGYWQLAITTVGGEQGYWCYSVNTGGPPSSFRNKAAFLLFF